MAATGGEYDLDVREAELAQTITRLVGDQDPQVAAKSGLNEGEPHQSILEAEESSTAAMAEGRALKDLPDKPGQLLESGLNVAFVPKSHPVLVACHRLVLKELVGTIGGCD